MENYLITAIILCFYLRTVLTEADLHQQNAAQDQLNPLNDLENADTSAKEQDKRTIFNSANYGWAKHVGIKPSGHKYVLGYSPVDLKYTPVIRPLTHKHPGYVYEKPKINFHLKRPTVQLRPVKPAVWKPAVPVKPIVSFHGPPPPPPHHHHLVAKPTGVAHVDHVHLKPVHHVDHVAHVDHVHPVQVPHTDVIHQVQVPHAGHVHNVPVHVDHVHPAPVPVHHLHVAHPGHVHNVPVHVDHVHPAAVPVPIGHVHPIHPIAQPVHAHIPQSLVPVVPQPQFIPSPLFEVTKPDLGVLPLGAAFPSPILKSFPHLHSLPLPIKPALVPQPIVPAALPLPQPVPVPRPSLIPQPVVPQHAYPPGTVVEYHGTTNFLNQIPLPQVPVNAVHPGLPPHVHLQYPQIPQHIHPQQVPAIPHEQHDVQTPVIPAGHPHFAQQPINQPHFAQQPINHPHFVQQPINHPHFAQQPINHPHFAQQPIDLPQFQQQLPLETSSHFQPTDQIDNNNLFQQQLPVNTQQTQFQTEQDNQFIEQPLPQDSGPRYQQADQVSSQQFFRGSVNPQQGHFEQLDQQEGGYSYPQPDVPFGQQSIQPGETDLQLPLQLPQHPGFSHNARQFQQSSAQESSQVQSVFRPSIQLEPPYKK